MPSFRSAKSQAQTAAAKMAAHGQARHTDREEGKAHSLRTEHAYRQQLQGVAQWMKDNGQMQGLHRITPELAHAYLEERAEAVCQKTVDLDRQALQALTGEKLERVRSDVATTGHGDRGRAYTPEQVRMVSEAQTERNSLATEIAHDAGLRTHELLTLAPADERPADDHREWSPDRFDGRENVAIYTVEGKGGLVREVAISRDLADRLEARRLEEPRQVVDREVRYEQRYDLGGGRAWTVSFSRAAERELGWSNGAHGLRHSYAQERVEALQQCGYDYQDAKAVVSQELGHFRADVVEAYLR